MPATIIKDPGEIFLTGNTAPIEVKTDSTFGAATGYFKVGIKIEYLGNTYFKLKQPILIPGDLLYGSATFDLSEGSDIEKTGHYTFPENSNKAIVHNICNTIVVTPFQRVGLNADVFGTSKTYYALNGKISEYKEAEINSSGKTLAMYFAQAGAKFLTDCPSPKQTDIYTPEKLYFIAYNTLSYRVKVRKYFKSGLETVEILKTIPAEKFSIIEIECSYEAIKTSDYKVYKYDIWLDYMNSPITEVYTFIVDRSYRAYARYFLAKNDWGVYEACRTYGKVLTKIEINKTLTEITDNTAITLQKRRYKQSNEQRDNIYDIELGNMLVHQRLWLITLLCSSRDVMFLKNNKTYPVTVKAFKDTISKDGQVIDSNKITVEHLLHTDFTNNYFSESPIVAQFDPEIFNPTDFNTVGEVEEIDQ